MSSESTKELIRRYTNLLNEANRSYYHNQTSIITDEAFNELYKTLAELEKEHPDLVCDDSPICTVGSDLTEDSVDKVAYDVPMLSIATKTDASLAPARDFITKVIKLLPNQEVEFTAEPKYDGLAINARYIDSRLVSLSTRGNKTLGENVTYNAHLVQYVPKELPEFIQGVLDVRGEVVVPTTLLASVAKTIFESMSQTYATPRHMAAALIRSKTPPPDTGVKPLVFMAYGVGVTGSFQPKTQVEVLNTLSVWGFECFSPAATPLTKDPQDLFDFKELLMRARPYLGYEVDGVVYKVNNLEQQRSLGVSGKEPRWAIAHKFPSSAKISTVLDIQYQVGKTGSLTPVVYIEPIEINGINIHKLSGSNLFDMRRKRIRIGAKVMVELGGDVIPGITMTLPLSSYLPNPKPPTICPSCGSPVKRLYHSAKTLCTNHDKCIPQVTARISYFTSRACANLSSLGEKTVQDLVTHCGVLHPYDLFTHSQESLKEFLPTYTAAKIKRVLQGVSELQSLPPEKVIDGLCIPGVGETVSIAFCKLTDDPGSLAMMSVQDLLDTGIFDKRTATSTREHFQRSTNVGKFWTLLAKLCGYQPLFNTDPNGNIIPNNSQPKVYNKRHYDVPQDAVYIGRPTKWGNPFSHLSGQSLAEHKVQTREESVQKFEEYLLSNPDLLEAAKKELKGKSLVCWCAPKSCHGDILIKYANTLNNKA